MKFRGFISIKTTLPRNKVDFITKVRLNFEFTIPNIIAISNP